jgi:hypothetical protein
MYAFLNTHVHIRKEGQNVDSQEELNGEVLDADTQAMRKYAAISI